MASRYWRLGIKGERSADEIQSAVGQIGGMIVRIHFQDDETLVYFTAEERVTAEVSKAIEGAEAPAEVGVDEATQLKGP